MPRRGIQTDSEACGEWRGTTPPTPCHPSGVGSLRHRRGTAGPRMHLVETSRSTTLWGSIRRGRCWASNRQSGGKGRSKYAVTLTNAYGAQCRPGRFDDPHLHPVAPARLRPDDAPRSVVDPADGRTPRAVCLHRLLDVGGVSGHALSPRFLPVAVLFAGTVRRIIARVVRHETHPVSGVASFGPRRSSFSGLPGGFVSPAMTTAARTTSHSGPIHPPAPSANLANAIEASSPCTRSIAALPFYRCRSLAPCCFTVVRRRFSSIASQGR